MEDEFHFVFHCPFYSELRKSLIESVQSKKKKIQIYFGNMKDRSCVGCLKMSEIYRKGLVSEAECVRYNNNLSLLLCLIYCITDFVMYDVTSMATMDAIVELFDNLLKSVY